MIKLSMWIAVVVGFLLVGGCSNFENEWRRADNARTAGAIPRKWEGRWASTRHQAMGGRLRCLFTPMDASHHRAWFRANWLTFASDYTVALATQPTAGGLTLRGAQVLHGFGGGLYRYKGSIERGHFTATYDSRYDRGRFDLRPVPSDSSKPQLTTRARIQ